HVKTRQSFKCESYQDEATVQVKSFFTERLKEARKRMKISQKELGIKMGMDPSSASGRMNHYETGRHMPDLATLKKLASELNVPVNYFFCESEESATLACLIEKLDDEGKRKLIQLLELEL
ncbi:MAG: helix-turn-helix domain-containing protein, partial [Pseudoalteromonas nigrifaciens]|uniref:helix-turn-helix domain-containing protein n=1 Tax=Pseudoalteromonas nigrifaciens TaxID=28109 RepID=UPI003F97BF41